MCLAPNRESGDSFARKAWATKTANRTLVYRFSRAGVLFTRTWACLVAFVGCTSKAGTLRFPLFLLLLATAMPSLPSNTVRMVLPCRNLRVGQISFTDAGHCRAIAHERRRVPYTRSLHRLAASGRPALNGKSGGAFAVMSAACCTLACLQPSSRRCHGSLSRPAAETIPRRPGVQRLVRPYRARPQFQLRLQARVFAAGMGIPRPRDERAAAAANPARNLHAPVAV